MNKSTIAGALAVISVIGSVVLFALGKDTGGTLVLGIATASVSWLHGYSTLNPKLNRDN